MTAAAVLAFLVRHEALLGWAAVALAACLLGGIAAHQLDAPKLAKAQAVAASAQAQAVAADQSARMTAAAAGAVEVARTTESHASRAAEEAADVLVHDPGADAPLPADVLRDWALGVDGLRDGARAAAPAGAADPGGVRPARPVPPA